MAFKIDETIYRNLQEQVKKNQCDISQLNAVNFAHFNGIRVDNVPDLPADAKIGEVVAVGTVPPYFYYIKTGEPKSYFNMGSIQSTIPGPQGEMGLKGDTGATVHWYTGYRDPETTLEAMPGDFYLNLKTGYLFRLKDDREWGIALTSIKGPQGAIGQRGFDGEQGPQGPQGPKGESAPILTIVGSVGTFEELPDAYAVKLNEAYLVGTEGNYFLYAIKLANGIRTWVKVQPFAFNLDASGIHYDHNTSGLEANNIQEAIDELEQKKSNKNPYVMTELPSGTTDKKTFYHNVIATLRNQKIYMFGTPEETPIKEFFDIWGKPSDFKATHVYIVIESVSNTPRRDSFAMVIHSSNYANMYFYVVSGYSSQLVGNGSGWISFNQITSDYFENNVVKPDGYYAKLTAGLSGGLVDSDGDIDKATYIERETYNGQALESGRTLATINYVGGNTIVKNQLVENDYLILNKNVFDLTITNNENGSLTYNGTIDGTHVIPFIDARRFDFNFKAKHKYYIAKLKGATSVRVVFNDNSYVENENGLLTSETDKKVNQVLFNVLAGTTFTNEIVFGLVLDLTQCFGAGNEPSSLENESLQKVLQIIKDNNYAYDSGTLISTKPTKLTSKSSDGTVLDTITIPSTKYFPNGMRSAGAIRDKLYKDKAVQNTNEVDLGTLKGWYLRPDRGGIKYATASIDDFPAKPVSNLSQIANIKISGDKYKVGNHWNAAEKLNYIAINDLGIVEINSDLFPSVPVEGLNDEVGKVLSGIKLIYELATPIITEITPKLDFEYVAEDKGIEKVDSNIPTFFDTLYYRNLLEKLKRLRTAKAQEEYDKTQDMLIEAIQDDLSNVNRYVDLSFDLSPNAQEMTFTSDLNGVRGIRFWYEFQYKSTIETKVETIYFVPGSSNRTYICNTMPDPALFSNSIAFEYKEATKVAKFYTTGSALPTSLKFINAKGVK